MVCHVYVRLKYLTLMLWIHHFQGGVVINVIEPGGAAAKDGRIAVGDQIIMVCLRDRIKLSEESPQRATLRSQGYD